ncbi:MAG: flagellin [Candidatus Lambdaproteobacteria bacterium]|nr:flagellin [Candidatus Lambdaproteobacteria bacterium]
MSSLVINHNTAAINTHRNLLNVDRRMKTSLEHLSSGEKIVRAADGPAALMISEQMRAQVASVTQAISNSETSVSMVQTTEAALDEVNRLLVSIRALAIHAANEGANDENMLNADQFEITNALESVDRVSQFAQFGTKKLLDGSRGVNGLAAGAALTFLRASEKTQGSPDEGYAINVTQVATKANVVGEIPLTKEYLNTPRTNDRGEPVNEKGQKVETAADADVKPVVLTVQESGRVARYVTKKGDDVNVVRRSLADAIEKAGLHVKVVNPGEGEPDDMRLELEHTEYGSEHKFVVASSVAGVLSKDEGKPDLVKNGQDVEGTIGDQFAVGRGQVLKGGPGTRADGLEVSYSPMAGEAPPNPDAPVGRVNVTNNSIIFQIGPNAGQQAKVSLESVSSRTLGRNVDNESGFQNLAQVNVTRAQGAKDTVKMVDKAIDDINNVRGRLGALQKNSLESNLRSLRVSKEELTSAESVLRDADMAEEMAEFTRNQVVLQSSMAMLSQANQNAQNVLALLRG